MMCSIDKDKDLIEAEKYEKIENSIPHHIIEQFQRETKESL
jgi:hypothetical protein